MNKTFLAFLLSFIIIPFCSAQIKASLLLQLGGTLPNSEFEAVGENTNLVSEANYIEFNYGIGIRIDHKNNWFSEYKFADFNQQIGMVATNTDSELTMTSLHEYHHWNISAAMGKRYLLQPKDISWSVHWQVGINLAMYPYSDQIIGKNIPFGSGARLLVNSLDLTFHDKIHPSIQAGLGINCQLYRPSISLILLLNQGLTTHVEGKQVFGINGTIYTANIRNRGSFLATYIQFSYPLGWNPKED